MSDLTNSGIPLNNEQLENLVRQTLLRVCQGRTDDEGCAELGRFIVYAIRERRGLAPSMPMAFQLTEFHVKSVKSGLDRGFQVYCNPLLNTDIFPTDRQVHIAPDLGSRLNTQHGITQDGSPAGQSQHQAPPLPPPAPAPPVPLNFGQQAQAMPPNNNQQSTAERGRSLSLFRQS